MKPHWARRVVLACGLTLSLMAAARGVAAIPGERLVNGGFEPVFPFGWQPVGTGETIAMSTLTSPFPFAGGPSTLSMQLTDAPGFNNPGLFQAFAPVSSGFAMSFDFRLGGPTPSTLSTWRVQALNSFNRTLIDLNLNLFDQFGIGGSQPVGLMPVIPLTWYHVELQGSFDTSTYSGTITPFGGYSVGWNDVPFLPFGGPADIEGIVITDLAILPSPQLHLDNFSFLAVPEPSVWMLAVASLLGLGGAAWRRRRAGSFNPPQGAGGAKL